jgi:hypothetical protein
MSKEVYIEVCHYNDRGDPYPPNNYRPELVIGDERFLPDRRGRHYSACMPEEEANNLARKIARILGIELRKK